MFFEIHNSDALPNGLPLLEEACPDERGDIGKGWGEVGHFRLSPNRISLSSPV
ncbi:hypothetical protein J0A67_17330 [Algoriphagus aestuariicola]|uniref:Uncharacterized protein n=1 Tax=Algoriphagus aestuariicola TaxID=1852016 RepID=A0ABS3BU88_9BACT|nr:hypothetical protein [Algoriphagus aestuariicola]MBN7802642.1 hypothetical protein [Algoriphagus aestuariicola]